MTLDELQASEQKREKGPLYEPSQDEIAAACREIRASWSAERWKRYERRDEWEVPQVNVGTEE